MRLYQNTVPIEQQSLTTSLNVSYTPRSLHHGQTQAISVTSETTICHLYVYLCNWFTCQIHALHEARFPPLQCIHKVCATLHLVQQAIHYTEWLTSNERKAYSLLVIELRISIQWCCGTNLTSSSAAYFTIHMHGFRFVTFLVPINFTHTAINLDLWIMWSYLELII